MSANGPSRTWAPSLFDLHFPSDDVECQNFPNLASELPTISENAYHSANSGFHPGESLITGGLNVANYMQAISRVLISAVFIVFGYIQFTHIGNYIANPAVIKVAGWTGILTPTIIAYIVASISSSCSTSRPPRPSASMCHPIFPPAAFGIRADIFGGKPSTTNIRSFAYLSPIFRASKYSGRTKQGRRSRQTHEARNGSSECSSRR